MNLPTIPERLQDNPRWGNFAVPWVTEWSRLDPNKPIVERHPLYGPSVGCDCVPGQGKPIFKDVCYVRQRQAFTDSLCGLCGQALEGPYIWFKAGDEPLYQEPPNHGECLMYAITACPALSGGAMRDPAAAVIEAVTYKVIYERTVEPDGYGDRALFDATTPFAVQRRVGYLRNLAAEPSAWAQFPVSQWMRRQRKRDRKAER